ncbi:MAG TPA: hypothetical protein PLL20_02850 [Phycisphaerae bacterium]|nr:hypothetical protein [Phycisphaerae bacterium]HRR86179.1 hypothetical protein [Phycisphaerae bacterium]
MAVARPQGSVGSSGLKAAAIGFAVAAVAAITFTIIMFTQKSDLEATASEAQRQARDQQRAAADARQALSDVAQEVIGKPAESLAEIKSAIDEIRTTVANDPQVKDAKITADQPVATMLNNLFSLYQKTAGRADELQAQHKKLNNDLEQAVKTRDDAAKAFETRVAELDEKFKKLMQESEQSREECNRQLAELQAARTKERDQMAGELDAARKARDEAEKTLNAEKNRTEGLLAQLAQFKPSSSGSALQVKDGVIVRTVPAGDIVYIDLGRSDGVRLGMTFSVYSPVRGIPTDGKGKATIEVVNVFETTAECRVTSRTPGEPILVNDIIANPVFDRSRQFTFAVIGDFDLNFDGRPEDIAGKEVSRLIDRLGGKVVNKVDTDTDFLVVGSPPTGPVPVIPGSEDEAAVTERNEQAAKRLSAFETMLKEARSLSIPILTRTQFLHFLGQSMPANTPDDTLPTL